MLVTNITKSIFEATQWEPETSKSNGNASACRRYGPGLSKVSNNSVVIVNASRQQVTDVSRSYGEAAVMEFRYL